MSMIAMPATAKPKGGISQFYSADRTLFWAGDPVLDSNFKKIPDVLMTASDHGINPQIFDVTLIQELMDENLDEKGHQTLDMAATYALWNYASVLAGHDLAPAEFVEIVFSGNLKQEILKLAPASPLYKALQERLKVIDGMSEADKQSLTYQKLTFGKDVFKVGDAHTDVPLLRARMVEYGGLESFGDDPYNYDSLLAESVKKFQAEHGLKADGIIGPSTLKYLNRDLDAEREQIVVNLHRLRQPEWRNRPDLRIDVDIARYWLKAYEGGKPIFEMPVVVGSSARQTEAFSTIMTGVRLNPGWTVPPTIKEEDYIPTLRTNPAALTEKGILIYADWSHESEPIDPTTVDWSLLSDNDIKAMRMYKKSGTSNPLGQYRFLMNNKYDIYLHDTNQHNLFSHAMRAQSSGCVRLDDPRKVAEFLLKETPGWTSEKIDEYLERGKTYDVAAKRHIPVYFDYKTAWLNKEGKLVLGVDIYDFDTDLDRDIIKNEQVIEDTISSYLGTISISAREKTRDNNKSNDGFSLSLF